MLPHTSLTKLQKEAHLLYQNMLDENDNSLNDGNCYLGAAAGLKLLTENDGQHVGIIVKARKGSRRVGGGENDDEEQADSYRQAGLIDSGIMAGWTLETVRALSGQGARDKGASMYKKWSYSSWDEKEEADMKTLLDIFEEIHAGPAAATTYHTPERVKYLDTDDIEKLIPSKFIPHSHNIIDNEGNAARNSSDSSLIRVCALCTALVNQYLSWTGHFKSTHQNQFPRTSAEWRRMHKLELVVQEVVLLFEMGVGESVTPHELTDPHFVQQCWLSLTSEDQAAVENVLLFSTEDGNDM